MGWARWGKREKTLEDRLRDERPQPPERLLRAILAEVDASRRGRSVLRSALRSSVLTAAALVGLLAVGGLGYFAGGITGSVTHFANIVLLDGSTTDTVTTGSGNDQYGTTTGATTTAAATTAAATTATTRAATTAAATSTARTTTAAPGTTTSPAGVVVASVPPASTGSVNLTAPDSTQPIASVIWSPGTFTQPVVIHANPAPQLTSTSLLGTQNQLVSISVTDDQGNPIHELPAPLEVVLHDPGKGFVPVVSEDGLNFRALTKIAGPPLPDDMQDGYFLDASGDVHILTRHLTIFAVLYKANVTTSESGRKLAAPGSGLWGDPTLIHTGPPVVRVVQTATATGTRVRFRFFLDEQAAGYFHVRYRGRNLLILPGKSTFRGRRIGGGARRTVHIPILRLGTMGAVLDTRELPAGATLRLTLIDYDGHRVVKTMRIRR